ncbi:hypothetical protein QJS10_CPB17g00831 [Acorus calamus]|uniref:Uncharacterized protein n=1 Tax=Acorus calamus TaxID=4465 RepID=A0AAV9CV26_ACOCL|nr:hypothetical protein QJS10_CPB17g00831 [Acorus calamus]
MHQEEAEAERHDPNTHKPLSDVEGGEEKASATTTHSDKASSSPNMDKLSLAESKPPLLVPDRNPFQASTKNSMTPTKEFFLDRFIGGQADGARNSDTMGYLSLPQLNYEADNQSASAGLSMNPNLWFGQSCARPFELSPDFSCNTISTLVPSVTSSNLSTPMGLMPLLGLPNENPPLGCVMSMESSTGRLGVAAIAAVVVEAIVVLDCGATTARRPSSMVVSSLGD